jgi:hypothetical protein
MEQIRLTKPVVLGSAKIEGFKIKLAPGTLIRLPEKLAEELVSAGLARAEKVRAPRRFETPEGC